MPRHIRIEADADLGNDSKTAGRHVSPRFGGHGTVMCHHILTGYVQEAGFGDARVLPIETDLWRFYQLV